MGNVVEYEGESEKDTTAKMEWNVQIKMVFMGMREEKEEDRTSEKRKNGERKNMIVQGMGKWPDPNENRRAGNGVACA